ncbi:hypothetical protein BVRB_5g117070 [Beta vulgaris subsp. vulgaris]|nr:hypothetical protein BVRB_5g117070 [Beta vulgaris subsp. vulgaris]
MVAHCLESAVVVQKDIRIVFVLIPEHVRDVYLKDLEYVPSSST